MMLARSYANTWKEQKTLLSTLSVKSLMTCVKRCAPNAGNGESSIARMLRAVAILFVAAALLPSDAHAWTPGTHIFLSDAVLKSLVLLPPMIAELLRAF